MLEATANTLQRMGDLAAAEGITAIRGKLPHDIPFPHRFYDVTSSLEEPDPERITFSDDDRRALKREGKIVLPLSPLSVRDIRELALRFGIMWTVGDPEFEAARAISSEVAIDPNQLYLHDSNNSPMEEQLEMIAEYSDDLSSRIPDVEAVLGGSSADQIALMINYHLATGSQLHGREYGHGYTRTATEAGEGQHMAIGSFDTGHGLRMWKVADSEANPKIWASPLIIPKRSLSTNGSKII